MTKKQANGILILLLVIAIAVIKPYVFTGTSMQTAFWAVVTWTAIYTAYKTIEV